MRKTIYFILMIMLVAAQTMSAAPAKTKSSKKAGSTKEWKGANRNLHHIAFWGGAGYSGLLNNSAYSRFKSATNIDTIISSSMPDRNSVSSPLWIRSRSLIRTM